jgi:hypothetical protein
LILFLSDNDMPILPQTPHRRKKRTAAKQILQQSSSCIFLFRLQAFSLQRLPMRLLPFRRAVPPPTPAGQR